MKQLTIISGKGGTGKTTLTASFATLTKNTIIVDADVGAPDLHLLLNPKLVQTDEYFGSKAAVIDKEMCLECNMCQDVCRFNAIDNFQINSLLCEGCGTCTLVCSEEAITMTDQPTGQTHFGETKYGFLIYANLFAGAEASGRLVTKVREIARRLCEQQYCELILLDGSPGIGCPVIASLTGADLALVVTEPTLSGLADLKRIVKLTKHFEIDTTVCVNKYDINLKNSQVIQEFCDNNGIEVVGMVPFDEQFNKALHLGKPFLEINSRSTAKLIEGIWSNICKSLDVESLVDLKVKGGE